MASGKSFPVLVRAHADCYSFTLCPAFGYDPSSWAQYQASCSTFWGSWAFLIGSVIQLYESLEKTSIRKEGSA